MPDNDLQQDWIIVADSDVIIRNVISDYLRHCGYGVIEAANAGEVITVLEEGSTTINAVLCDVALDGSLPDLNGSMNAFSLRLWAREHWPHMQFILAGTVTAEATAAGRMCDEGPHLSRPYDPQIVVDHIKRLLAAARK